MYYVINEYNGHVLSFSNYFIEHIKFTSIFIQTFPKIYNTIRNYELSHCMVSTYNNFDDNVHWLIIDEKDIPLARLCGLDFFYHTKYDDLYTHRRNFLFDNAEKCDTLVRTSQKE